MAAPTRKDACTALLLGPLNVDIVNDTLDTELEPGDLYLSREAHWHIACDHTADYDACIAALHRIGNAPSLLGQAPKHGRNFEMIARFRSADPARSYVLIAVGLERDERGSYRVKSAYSLAEHEVTKRRMKGHLKAPILKAFTPR